MKRLLVTNDDGIESPALLPLLRALAPLGEVRAVVPDGERSWISKAITRNDPVHVEPRKLEGHDVHACSGTPADCANLGIHTLFAEPPDLLVSGVNLGLNQSEAMAGSSGTIGAASEAAWSGVAALAVSVGPRLPDPSFQVRCREPAHAAHWDEAAAVAAEVAHTLLERGLPPGADLLSVNMPEGATARTARRVTRLARLRYGALFQPASPASPPSATSAPGGAGHEAPETSRWRFRFPGLQSLADNPLDGTDEEALAKGFVAITALRLGGSARVDGPWIDRLER